MESVGKRVVYADAELCGEVKKKARRETESSAESDFEDVPEVEDTEFVSKLALRLEDMIAESGKVMQKDDLPEGSQLRAFFSTQKQSFSLAFYIRRLVDYAHCSSSAFVLMIVYLERVLAAERSLMLSEYNVHRLATTALVLAAKYLEDVVHTNLYYSKVGGISTIKEMNNLEAEMLSILKFNTFVDTKSFERYHHQLLCC